MSRLFSPATLRELTLPNRIVVSPMCQYSAESGQAQAWHMIHLGSLALSGAGMLVLEATAVEPEGHITPGDLGLYDDATEAALVPVLAAIRKHSSIAVAMQVAHAGRKASCRVPWEGGAQIAPDEQGGWRTSAPSALAFRSTEAAPTALDAAGLARVRAAFAGTARRAARLGFDALEVHGAHGYLLHEFLSPLANHRTDEYGGALENRARFLVETARAVRAAMGETLPLAARLSCTDWAEGGFTPAEAVQVSRWLKEAGVDLIDCSSGGLAVQQQIPLGPGYQVQFAQQVRAEAGIATASVGMITDPKQADEIIRSGAADLVLLARAELNDPYWPIHAALALGQPAPVPAQYSRGFPSQPKRSNT